MPMKLQIYSFTGITHISEKISIWLMEAAKEGEIKSPHKVH